MFPLNKLLPLLISPLLFAATTPKPYVTPRLKGQLGNQMNIIAATLSFAWDNDMIPLFPDLTKPEYNLFNNYNRIFYTLNTSTPPRPHQNYFSHFQNFAYNPIPIIGDQILEGYFHHWEYHRHHRDRIISLFQPRPQELSIIRKKYHHLLTHPCTVAIHVRTYNKKVSKGFPFLGLDYYKKAIELFPPEALFVIFSDRIGWCKQHFKTLNRPIAFIESGDYIEDFFLMTLLHHHIIANSTYSWWAAYLNQNPNQIVVAPTPFYTIRGLTHPDPNLPHWISLTYTPPTYPSDINQYKSQSFDTQ